MSAERTERVVFGTGHGTDRQEAEVSVVNGHIWLTFLGPRGGRQYTVPMSVGGAMDMSTMLRHAAVAARDSR